jgi:outer membrane receptor protein involved in Fe transport
MAGDPPLKQVVTKTLELGLHGLFTNGIRWNAGVFRAENHDDILFVAAPNNTQFGYFRNFGKTRRDGLELGASRKSGALNIGANYTYLNATYQSSESVNGTGNSSNDLALIGEPGQEGTIQIRPGNRMPLIPHHMFKMYADYQFTGTITAGLNLIAIGNSIARGNENGAHTPDGTVYLGSGKSGGYAVLNFNAQYQADKQLKFFTQVNNLLNRKYHTAAQLGPTGFTNNGNFVAQPLPATVSGEFPVRQAAFYAPGAPRTIWVGVRYQFEKPTPKD